MKTEGEIRKKLLELEQEYLKQNNYGRMIVGQKLVILNWVLNQEYIGVKE